MRRSQVGGGLIATLVAGLLGVASPAGSAPGPAGEIHVDGQAYEGRFDTFEGPYDTFTGTLRLRCRPGLEASAVRLSFSQDGTTSPEIDAAVLPSCDGTWQQQSYVSPEGFHPGRAVVNVRLALVEATSGAPRGAVSVSEGVYVRPAAKMILPRSVELLPDGVLEVRVRVRCDRPWELLGSFVTAEQFRAEAMDNRVLDDIPCDGEYHRRTTHLQTDEDRQFGRGRVRLTGDVILLDPEFDDAMSASSTRTYRLR